MKNSSNKKYLVDYKIIKNSKIANKTYELILSGPTDWIKPGRFINLQIPNKYLKRPMSICEWDKSKLKIIYKVCGEGTKILTTIKPGNYLQCLIDLGNYYILNKTAKEQLVVGCGSGIGSVYSLLKELKNNKIKTTCILGFKTKSDVFYLDKIKKLVNKLIICTDDGSIGFKDNPIEVMKKYNLLNHYFYTCGPIEMMKNLAKTTKSNGQFSLEARMGCGYGCCMGCTILTKNGPRRICKEGPVFRSEQLLWEEI